MNTTTRIESIDIVYANNIILYNTRDKWDLEKKKKVTKSKYKSWFSTYGEQFDVENCEHNLSLQEQWKIDYKK